MKHFATVITATIAAVVTVAVASSTVAGQGAKAPTARATDEAALRKVVRQVQDGWNAHDGKAFAAPFAQDADYVVVNGEHVKGRAAIEGGHKAIFSTIYKDSNNTATIKSVRFLRADVALVHVQWHLKFRQGDTMHEGRAMNTMVLTKEKGRWSIAAYQNTPIGSFGS